MISKRLILKAHIIEFADPFWFPNLFYFFVEALLSNNQIPSARNRKINLAWFMVSSFHYWSMEKKKMLFILLLCTVHRLASSFFRGVNRAVFWYVLWDKSRTVSHVMILIFGFTCQISLEVNRQFKREFPAAFDLTLKRHCWGLIYTLLSKHNVCTVLKSFWWLFFCLTTFFSSSFNGFVVEETSRA